jgi:hypothetical protein
VVLTLGKPQLRFTGNPWKNQRDAKALGHVLKREDLGDEDLENLHVLQWKNHEVCVIIRQEVVQALIVRYPQRGENGRGVKIGDKEARLVHLYSSELAKEDFFAGASAAAQPTKKGKVYRYDALGIGFEVQNERVTAITLYPAIR